MTRGRCPNCGAARNVKRDACRYCGEAYPKPLNENSTPAEVAAALEAPTAPLVRGRARLGFG